MDHEVNEVHPQCQTASLENKPVHVGDKQVNVLNFWCRWYFVELSWHRDDGARMYVDLQEVDSAADPTDADRPRGGDSHMYIGRANTAMRREKYADAKVRRQNK